MVQKFGGQKTEVRGRMTDVKILNAQLAISNIFDETGRFFSGGYSDT